jgi:hypothetical protein
MDNHALYGILLVSVEHAIECRFFQLVLLLKTQGKLSRIFIDEIHLYLEHQSFRRSISELNNLIHFSVPIVGLSGTIIKGEERKLQPILGNKFWHVRSTKLLPKNVSYRVRMTNCEDLEMSTSNLVSDLYNTLEAPKSRVICYTMTVTEVTTISNILLSQKIPVCSFTSQMSDAEQKMAFNGWIDGKYVVMVATSGFSVGIDYPFVKYVVLHGFSYSIAAFLQQSGRVARKTGEGACILNTSPHYVYYVSKMMNDFYLEERLSRMRIMEFIHFKSCRRNFLMLSVDNSTSFCEDEEHMALCDFCLKKEFNDSDSDFLENVSVNEQPTVDSDSSAMNTYDQNTFFESIEPITLLKPSQTEIDMEPPSERQYCLLNIALHAKDFLNDLENCIICYSLLQSRHQVRSHSSTNCPVCISRCYICLRKSCGQNCSFKTVFADTRNICYGCGLTIKYSNETIHVNQLGNKCPYKCVLVRFCWILWYNLSLRTTYIMTKHVGCLRFWFRKFFSISEPRNMYVFLVRNCILI